MTVTEPTPETVEADRSVDAANEPAAHDEVVEETLVEEISIDGMCGVY